MKASSASASKKSKTIVVGSRRFTVTPGNSADVTFNLNAQGKKALERRGTLPVKVTTEVRQGASKPVVATRSFPIKLPKTRPKKHG